MVEVDDTAREKTAKLNPETDPASLEQLARRSELIFLGSVEEPGPSPSHWSGYFPSCQEVRYRVDEIIKGEIPGDEVVVRHVVVRNSPTAEPGDAPGLSSQLFSKGAKLLVLGIDDGRGQWVSMSERFGARPHSAEVVEQVRAAALAPNRRQQ